MTIHFVNRVEELKKLDREGRLHIVFGRRRVGKTALVKHFAAQKNALYLLAVNKPAAYNLQRFAGQLSKRFDIPGLHFPDFLEMFRFLESRDIDIVIIDEFGYLIEQGILPEFQEIVDEVITKKTILTGSSISLMEAEVLNYKSPIYGRVDSVMHLLPLKISHLLEWFPDVAFENIFKIYAVVGGTARYLEFFRGHRVAEEIKEQLFFQSFLFYDARKVLEEELREPMRYFMILEAIAKGRNTLNEIKNFTHIESNKLPFYIGKLKRLKLVNSVKPLIQPKKQVYSIGDNYLKFWFRFVYPFEEEIDSMMPEGALYSFEKGFNTYLGTVFEEVAREVVRLKFPFPRIGFQFGSIPKKLRNSPSDTTYEIDILALNEDENEILLGECKWSEGVNAAKILNKLHERAGYIPWKSSDSSGVKKTYTVFARSFKDNEKPVEWEGKRVYCFDLGDMEQILGKGIKK
ncbi:MAG: ATP-binding protein [bacterium]|nr:ATP-binding protein [bacterium]